MTFKFYPKGDYKVGQKVTIQGVEYTLTSRQTFGNWLASDGKQNIILVVLTDEEPIYEKKA